MKTINIEKKQKDETEKTCKNKKKQKHAKNEKIRRENHWKLGIGKYKNVFTS